MDTMEEVQRCVEHCSESLQRAQGIIGQELQTYQASVILLLQLLTYVQGEPKNRLFFRNL